MRAYVPPTLRAGLSDGGQALQPSTIRTRFKNVRTVIRAAVTDRAIPFDPTAKVRLPRTRRVEAAMRIPTPAEVGAVIGKAEARFAGELPLA